MASLRDDIMDRLKRYRDSKKRMMGKAIKKEDYAEVRRLEIEEETAHDMASILSDVLKKHKQ